MGVDAVRRAGGVVYYSHQVKSLTDRPSRLREAVANLLGEEWAYSVAGVILYPDAQHPADAIVQSVTGLPWLQKLTIWPECRGVKYLNNKASFGITDAGADFILENLPCLTHLCVSAAQLSDGKIDELLQQPKFAELQITRHPNFGNEDAVDTWPEKDGTYRIVDLRNRSR